MKILLIISHMLLVLSACQSDVTHAETLQEVPRIVYEIYPNDWYVQQENLWKKEIDKNPQNAHAWHNYYNAVRYAKFVESIDTPSKNDRLQQIIREAEKAIPNSYEFYLIKFKTEHSFENIDLIEKAHKLKPDAPEPYYDLITDQEIKGNMEMVHQYYEELYATRDVAQWLLNYNYNMLMSVEQNGILLTNGDNDTYPARMLQEVHGIRTDVTILNISMSAIDSYFNRKLREKGISLDSEELMRQGKSDGGFNSSLFIQAVTRAVSKTTPEIPIHFALTVYKKHFQPFKENMYIVGLAYRYSPHRIDNLAAIKKHFEQDFRLDYISFDWYAKDRPGKRLMSRIQLNYAPSAIMLADHYQASGESRQARRWYSLAMKIAREANENELMAEIQSKFAVKQD